jgi:hypothetical protein
MTVPFRLFRHLALCALATTVVACSSERKVETRVAGNDHFVSNGDQPTPIDVAAVEKAFWDTKGADFQAWMGAFEKRVNELYDGGVVSLDARRNASDLLAVTGFLDRNNQPGFQAGGDATLFAIEQTDPARNNQMAYRVGGYDGHYYQHSHSLLDSPFVQMMVLGSLLHRPYYTPHDRVAVLRDHQSSYRRTPAYQEASRVRKRLFGTTRSQRSFGSAGGSSGSGTARSWFGGKQSTSATTGSTTWSGRRSTGSSGSSTSSSGSRSWFGGSSGSSSRSTSSWSGRRSSGSSGWGSSSSRSSGSSRRSWGGRRR